MIVAAAAIFVLRTLNAGDIVVQTVLKSPEPIPATTTTATTPAFVDPKGFQATKVVRVVAIDKSGNPAPGYVIAEGAGADLPSCQRSSSGLDAGVVGCAPNAAGADVCWVTPTPRTVLCGDGPWDKTLFRLTAGRMDEALPGVEAQPWGVELADGAKGVRRRGGSWPGRADGLAGAYSCDRENEFVLAGDGPVVDRTKPSWTVRIGDLGEPDASFPPPADMRVVTAYFAASP